jgi:hypothetical protein
LTGTDWASKADNHGLFLRLDSKETGAKENDDQQDHHDFDDPKAAAQRFGKRFGTGIDVLFRRRNWLAWFL